MNDLGTRPQEGASRESIEDFVERCLTALSLEEKVYMMSGHGFLDQYLADGGDYNVSAYQCGGGNERLGLPKLMFTDGPRGVALGNSTCFPVAMARGASFDPSLEERIGDAIGKEIRAHGANFFGGICINLLRHPAWGRAQETYGEDPHHLGRMGSALAKGVQRHNVVATIKHFACNSIENARFKVDVKVGERALREVYLPHFKYCLDEGAASVMSAYNKVRGAYCGHNRELLRDILKDEWGFDGFVHSDFVRGCYGPDAAAAGLDVENPETNFFGEPLMAAIEAGEVSTDAIDDAVRRILRTAIWFETRPDPEAYDTSLIACASHRAIAQEAAEQSAVLLQNNGVLPLGGSQGKIAVFGKLASEASLGDHGSSFVRPPEVTPILAGLLAHEGLGPRIEDASSLEGAEAAAAAADSEVAVVVVGYTHEDEGEWIPNDLSMAEGGKGKGIGGDRDSLALPEKDVRLIESVSAANPRTVVVVIAGSAVTMSDWSASVDGILMLWYPGMEGGHALARLLYGDVSPSGRLPFTIPESEDHLPFFDKDADAIDYGLFHGYTKLARENHAPAFPFGFGLTYSQFSYGTPAVEADGDGWRVSAEITNDGRNAAAEVAQLYVGPADPGASSIERAVRLLRGFEKLTLDPGAKAVVEFRIAAEDLAHYDEDRRGWTVEPVEYAAWIAPDSLCRGAEPARFRADG